MKSRLKPYSLLFIIILLVITLGFACNGETPPTGDPTPPNANVYTVRLDLSCTVKDDYGQDKVIECTYDGKTQAQMDGLPLTVEIDKSLSTLKNATPPTGNTVGAEEYRFVGWYYNDIKVDNTTVFSKTTFGDVTTITLTVKCERVFSPQMPL